ncbi:hypothetical protein C804_01981 [Lachnospiraceae bacterium A4]|nr:hypothetical protein C804_01981 [Lachnospiraceae bacterium A4]
MARIKYGCYLLNEQHCYVITNADTEYAEDITEESFINPPIKMTVETIDADWEDTFDAEENPFNHSNIQENLMGVLRGESPEWRLTGVNVSGNGIYLVYATTLPPEELYGGNESYSGGQVIVHGNCTLLFEVVHADGLPANQYRVKVDTIANHCYKRVQITEYTARRKCRELVINGENYDVPYITGQQYCVITEY